MNLLLDRLPTSVELSGTEYPIHWNFRTMILFEQLMQDAELPREQRLLLGLHLFYPTLPEDVAAALDFLLFFYKGGREPQEASDGKSGKNNTRIYSFEEDDGLILAAFLGQYGVDLNEVEALHWWKFRAMFCALEDHNEIVKVMGYRAMDIPAAMSKEQKAFYRGMKKKYALPLPASEREKLSKIEEALLGGGDLSGLL